MFWEKSKEIIKWGGKRRTAGESIILVETKETDSSPESYNITGSKKKKYHKPTLLHVGVREIKAQQIN